MLTHVSSEQLFWCGLFFILGPSLIVLNNHVLNRVQFKYPILFSSLGIWGTAILSIVLKKVGIVQVEKQMHWRFWCLRIFPLGLLSAATIATGNSVYLYLSVSFTQMLKALTPVYILLCLVAFKVEIPQRAVVIAVSLISIGTMVSSVGELKFSWTGFLLQSIADLFEGSRLVLTQILLSNNGLTPIESLYFIYPATAVSQFFMVVLYEQSAITDPVNWKVALDNWYLFVLAIILGIAVNFVGIFVIKHTSGLMLKLIGVIRNNFLVLLAIVFLGDETSSLQFCGYLVSIGGFIWYVTLTMGNVAEVGKARAGNELSEYSKVPVSEESDSDVI